eukprot:11551099-Ditylum_brightwellii.AAC.1
MLTMKGIHHPKGNVHCIYLHRSKDRRGLMRVENIHNCEYAALAKYVLNSTDTFTQMCLAMRFPPEVICQKLSYWICHAAVLSSVFSVHVRVLNHAFCVEMLEIWKLHAWRLPT